MFSEKAGSSNNALVLNCGVDRVVLESLGTRTQRLALESSSGHCE